MESWLLDYSFFADIAPEIRASKRETSFGQRLLKEKAFQFQNNLEYIASSLFNKLLILEDTVLALFP